MTKLIIAHYFGQWRHLLIRVPFKVPLASKARMNDAFNGLKTSSDPRELTQLT